jgi:hypothetical protein
VREKQGERLLGRVPGDNVFNAPVSLPSFYPGVGRQLYYKRIVRQKVRMLVTP